MLRRSFSNREKVMLLALTLILLVALYYKVVYEPSSIAISAAESQRLDAEDQLQIEMLKLQNYKEMQTYITQYNESPDAKLFPDYDNIANVMIELNTILSNSDSYKLSFSDVTFESNVAYRPIDMTYTCSSYRKAREVLDMLYDCTYRCSIGSLTFACADSGSTTSGDLSDGDVSVKLTVTFYESAVGYPIVTEETPAADTAATA